MRICEILQWHPCGSPVVEIKLKHAFENRNQRSLIARRRANVTSQLWYEKTAMLSL